MTKDIYINDSKYVKYLEKVPEKFVNKTIVIYGKRGTGKTVLVEDILYICRDSFSIVFIISGSNVSTDESFIGKVPNTCIKNGVTSEWLDKLMQSQTVRSHLYKTSQNIENLKHVFDFIDDHVVHDFKEKIDELFTKYNNSIDVSKTMSNVEKDRERKKMKKTYKNELKNHYKQSIIKNLSILREKVKNGEIVETDHKIVIKYIQFVPHILLVFDDCASQLKELSKLETIKNIFYNGRHFNITMLITTQSDKELPSEIRSNTDLSIFTTREAASTAFTRVGFSSSVKKEADIYSNAVFSSIKGEKNYNKLVYNTNDDSNPFQYILGDEHEAFIVGSDALWQLGEKIDSKKKSINKGVEFSLDDFL